ncbi:MAG: DUF899 family protein [Rhizobiales bacterium]|nr:DUF899 family protein [Hyphomicrobiales bacterium]
MQDAIRSPDATETELGRNEFAVPPVVDRSIFQAELDALRVREKAHTREGDAIAAVRRWLPMQVPAPLSASGTELKSRHVRYPVTIKRKADLARTAQFGSD